MGAAYVVTGSVNQACVESGTSDAVRQMLAEAGQADVAMAPAADMFEMGVKVQVLKRGTHVRRCGRPSCTSSTGPTPAWTRSRRPSARQLEKNAVPRPARRGLGADARRSSCSRDPAQIAAGRGATRSTRWRWCSAGTSASRRAGPTPASRTRQARLPGLVRPGDGGVQRVGQGLVPGAAEEPHASSTVALNLLYGAAVALRQCTLRPQGVNLPTSCSRTGRLERAGTAARACGRTHGRADQTSAARRTMPSVNAGLTPNQRPAGDHRHRLPVPEGGRPRRVTGPTSRTASTASPTSRRRTGDPDDYFDPDPKAPDLTYARRGGVPRPGRLQPARVRHRAERPRGHRHHPAARPGRRPAGARRRRLRRTGPRPFDRDRDQRDPRRHRHAGAGHPARRPARPPDLAAGAAATPASPTTTADDVVAADRRLATSPLAGELVPRPARQRRRRADRQPARPRRHQLRRRRRLRQLARAPSTWPALELQTGRCRRGRHRRRRHVQRHLHVHVLQQDAGAVADRATRGRSTPTATARSWARGSGVVVLKRLADAERDGDRVYAVLKAIGTSSDGKGNAIYAPSAGGPGRGAAERVRAGGRRARPRSNWSRPTAPGRRSATRPRSTALTEVFREAQRRTATVVRRSGRSSRRSATPRRRPARRG